MTRRPPSSTLFPYPPLFRSLLLASRVVAAVLTQVALLAAGVDLGSHDRAVRDKFVQLSLEPVVGLLGQPRSEEHTSELQSRSDLVGRLLLEKKKLLSPGPAD